MKTTQRILRTYTYLLLSIFLLCGCHGKKTSLDGMNKDTNIVSLKINSTQIAKGISHTDTVFISDMKFLPNVIKVHNGDTVVWVNKDLVMHNVTELTGKGWASPPIHSGASWKMAVKQATDYHCSIHPEMKGKIILE